VCVAVRNIKAGGTWEHSHSIHNSKRIGIDLTSSRGPGSKVVLPGQIKYKRNI